VAISGVSLPLMEISTLIGLGIPALALVSLWWFNWGRPKFRKTKLNRGGGFSLRFQEKMNDPEDKWKSEVWLPAGSEVDIQLRAKARMAFKQKAIKFGFEGAEGERPKPEEYFNTFVKVGRASMSPQTDPTTHYIDKKDCYNINKERTWSADDVVSYGFKVKTQQPGRYPVKFVVTTEEGDAFPDAPLFVNVALQPIFSPTKKV
jgi:hypothetical protein